MNPSGSQSIRIAFLGADSTTLDLARTAVASNRYSLAGACELEDAADRDLQAASFLDERTRSIEHWEALLDPNSVDVVVVARGADEDRRADQLRKLIQAGVPLLISHPVVDSMLVYYELDMIRRETGCIVVPYLPYRHHPAVREMSKLVALGSAAPIGKAEQVLMQRCIAHPTKPGVLAQFARDVDLVRSVAGDLTRLGAMDAGGERSDYASVGVQMSGPAGLAARWSVDPNQSDEGAQLSVLGAQGKAVVTIPVDGQAWTMSLSADGKSENKSYAGWNPAVQALGDLELALGGEAGQPDWVDAARSVELTETIERSLKKGRTIELYYEDYTEQGTFKGTMTSLGCGLLVVGMILLGVVAIAEQAGVPYLKGWPFLFLGLFGGFLLLQLLMLVFREQSTPSPDDAPDEIQN